MKTTRFFLALFITVLSLGMISCDKDDDNNTPEVPRTLKLPVKLQYEDGKSLNYLYDDNLRLVRMEFILGEENVITADITYNADGKVCKTSIQQNAELVFTYDFTYTGRIISVSSLYGGDTHTIELNDNGQLFKIKGRNGLGEDLTYKYDPKGNITEEAQYSSNILISKNIYNYDYRNGYNKNVNVPVWLGHYLMLEDLFPAKVNNEVGEFYYNPDDKTLTPSTHARYEYDNEDYPLNITFLFEEQVLNKLTVVYENKSFK